MPAVRVQTPSSTYYVRQAFDGLSADANDPVRNLSHAEAERRTRCFRDVGLDANVVPHPDEEASA